MSRYCLFLPNVDNLVVRAWLEVNVREDRLSQVADAEMQTRKRNVGSRSGMWGLSSLSCRLHMYTYVKKEFPGLIAPGLQSESDTNARL